MSDKVNFVAHALELATTRLAQVHSVFPVVLADALDRALASNESVIPEVTASTDFMAAEAS